MVGFVFEESGGTQRFNKMTLQLCHIQFSGGSDEKRTQVEPGLFSIEALETLNQDWRNDQRGVRILIEITNQQSGPVFDGRRHEIEIHAQTGEGL